MKTKPKRKHLEKSYGKLPPAPEGHRWKVMDALEVRKVGQWCVALVSSEGYWHWSTAHALVNKEDEEKITKPYFKAVKISKTKRLKNEVKELKKTISDMSARNPAASHRENQPTDKADKHNTVADEKPETTAENLTEKSSKVECSGSLAPDILPLEDPWIGGIPDDEYKPAYRYISKRSAPDSMGKGMVIWSSHLIGYRGQESGIMLDPAWGEVLERDTS